MLGLIPKLYLFQKFYFNIEGRELGRPRRRWDDNTEMG
jgi:hypothetical protein